MTRQTNFERLSPAGLFGGGGVNFNATTAIMCGSGLLVTAFLRAVRTAHAAGVGASHVPIEKMQPSRAITWAT
jgi:hypothetical protein